MLNSDATVLAVLRRFRGLTRQELALHSGLAPRTIDRVLVRLEAAELVERVHKIPQLKGPGRPRAVWGLV